MVNVVGPLMSLSASGSMGKALFYYDTKWGARVRSPKRTFEPPCQAWVINQELFEMASARSKLLTKEQRWAWKTAYSEICDTWRDIFMGQQIEAWTLSPLNDLTWPQLKPGDIGPYTFYCEGEEFQSLGWAFDEFDKLKVTRWCSNSLWFRILDTNHYPTEDDIFRASESFSCTFEVEDGHKNYLWGGLRFIDGSYEARYLTMIDMT